MTKILVDLGKCQGYANCVVAAPDIFDLGDTGRVELLEATVADDRLDDVREAIRSCPAAALTLEEPAS
ncbi:ferredoxin [Rhodococcus zopfii]|uniref:Ferredoxin n=1 Tax=Rhodococcus zopfii TaxID=43772 RepID=A0ABU3WQA0_9NOCA|nr:ferredoxin [Rhodococcus zopfii]